MDTLLSGLRARQVFDDLDTGLADLLARLSGDATPALLLAAACASRATGEGHVCADLAELAGRPLAVADGGPAVRAPALDEWLAALRRSAVVGGPGAFRPLVLDAAGRLYLWRYHEYQQRLAAALAARARGVLPADEALLADGLRRLFPAAGRAAPDHQMLAAAVAVLKPLCVISGGPGTGKTTAVTRILALLVEQAQAAGGAPPRMALAAPTGKAAARMQESARAALAGLAVADAVRAALPVQASTIHRLLGARPGLTSFRHDAANPLPVDVLVVDEASMVDLALMARLLDAVPAGARLVLLGDRDQLASVEAGAVLGDICEGAGGFTRDFAARLAPLLGAPPPARATGGALDDCVVLLTHSHRFAAGSAIGRLAAAVRDGDAGAALAIMDEGGEVLLDEGADGITAALRAAGLEGFGPWLDSVHGGTEPAAVLRDFARYRVLCAHREGARGVAVMNSGLAAVFAADGRVLPRPGWFAGRAVMVTRNEYSLRLFNGDVGVALAGTDNLRVWFESAAGAAPRAISPGRLPQHEHVWAMTVHKSQGSEFDGVTLVLPEGPSPVLTRELVYTAVTRARSRLHIIGRREVLAAALAARVTRRSGLREALAAAVRTTSAR